MRAALFVLLLAATSATAQIYRWVDDKGRVQYGENPPAGAKASAVQGDALPRQSSRPPPAEDLQRQEREFRQRQVKQREQDDRDAAAAKRGQARCQQMRNELAFYENARRIASYQNGERVYLSDGERNEKLGKMRDEIARNCR